MAAEENKILSRHQDPSKHFSLFLNDWNEFQASNQGSEVGIWRWGDQVASHIVNFNEIVERHFKAT